MKAVSSIASTSGVDKATASSTVAGSQAASGDSGFLAMLDGMIQAPVPGQANGQTLAQGDNKGAATASAQAGQDEDNSDQNPGDQASIADAALDLQATTQGAVAAPSSVAVIPLSGLVAAAQSTVATPSALPPSNVLTTAAQAGLAQPNAAVSVPATNVVVPATANAGGNVRLAPTTPLSPQATALPQVPASQSPLAAPVTMPVVSPDASQIAVPPQVQDANQDIIAASAEVALPAISTASSDSVAAQGSSTTTAKTVPAAAGTTNASSDPQQSALIAALLSQGQLPEAVAQATPILQVSSGSTRAGTSSVSGVGTSPTLLPPPAGNGISFFAAPKAASTSEQSDDDSSSSPSGAKTPLFGIGTGDVQSSSTTAQPGDAQDATADAATTVQTATTDPVRPQDISALFAVQPDQIARTAKASDAADDTSTGVSGVGSTATVSPTGDTNFTGLTLVHGGSGATQATQASGTTFASSSTMNTTPADQVSIVMQRAASNGDRSMTISLDPVELGKVTVKLDIAKDGSVQASIAADRPETLTMLKNDHQTLTQALQSAGLTADSSSLSFNLSDSSSSKQDQTSQQSSQSGSAYDDVSGLDADTDTQQLSAITAAYTVSNGAGRVDVLA